MTPSYFSKSHPEQMAELLRSIDTKVGAAPLLEGGTREDTQLEVRDALRRAVGDDAYAKLEAIRALLADLAPALEEVSIANMIPPVETGLSKEVTLEALRAAFVGEDFATQTTLEALRQAFVAEDFATQATLEALRAAFVAEDFATQTTLASLHPPLIGIESTVFRRTDPLATGSNIVGFVSSALDRKVAESKVYRAGGEVSTSVTSPNGSLTLLNPATSTKTVYVVGAAVYADASASALFMEDAVSTGTVVVANNMDTAAADASVVEARVGSGVVTGGQTWSARARVTPDSPLVRDMYVRLPPGKSLTAYFLGPGATNLVTFNATWYEE